MNGHVAVVQQLIGAGADVNHADKWGTPLVDAKAEGHDEIVALLTAAGAKAPPQA